MTDYLQTVEWSFPQFIAVLAGFIVGGGVGGVIAIGFDQVTLSLDAGETIVTPLGLFISVSAQFAGGLAVLILLSRTRGTGNLAADFGLRLRLEQWWGIPAGAALQIGAVIVTAPLLRVFFPEGPPQQSVVDVTEASETAIETILIIVALVILAPVVEELIFRGMLLSRLVRSMAIWAAILSQAAIFALIHLADPRAIAVIPGLILIAAALGYAAIKTGDLSLPIFLHAGVNLTAALLLLYGAELLDWLDEMAGLEPSEALLWLIP